jgi:hypothetical protein
VRLSTTPLIAARFLGSRPQAKCRTSPDSQQNRFPADWGDQALFCVRNDSEMADGPSQSGARESPPASNRVDLAPSRMARSAAAIFTHISKFSARCRYDHAKSLRDAFLSRYVVVAANSAHSEAARARSSNSVRLSMPHNVDAFARFHFSTKRKVELFCCDRDDPRRAVHFMQIFSPNASLPCESRRVDECGRGIGLREVAPQGAGLVVKSRQAQRGRIHDLEPSLGPARSVRVHGGSVQGG